MLKDFYISKAIEKLENPSKEVDLFITQKN